MTPAADWQQQLGALRDSLPGGELPPEDESAEVRDPERQKGRVDILLDKKGRAGKSATIISGFDCGEDTLRALAADLKRSLATGGSVRGTEILVQGDRRKDVAAFLTGRNIKNRII